MTNTYLCPAAKQAVQKIMGAENSSHQDELIQLKIKIIYAM